MVDIVQGLALVDRAIEDEHGRTGAAAAVSHVGIDEDLLDAFDLANTLVELDVGMYAAGDGDFGHTRLA